MSSQAAVSGIQANNQALASVYFDIANSLSIGHKGGREFFSSLVASSGGSGSSGGTMCKIIQLIGEQGVLQNSTSPTDMAISGNGFFVTSVQEASLDIQYTRAGVFSPDLHGSLITPNGAYLLGYTDIDEKGDILPTINPSDPNSLKHISVNRIAGTAKATASLSQVANLPSTDAIGAVETSNVKIFDALGASHTLQLIFTRTAITPCTWTMDITCTDGISTILRSDTLAPYSIVISFDGQGRPTGFDGQPTPPQITCNWDATVTNADPTILTSFDLGTVGAYDGVTCRAGEFTSTPSADGSEFGTFRNVSIDSGGRVSAIYSNGQTLIIARVVLANFAAPDQLEALTGDAFIATQGSGTGILTLPGKGGIGKIAAFALESSTVDLAQKLTSLIELNNAYTANTKSIKTDEKVTSDLLAVI